MDLSIEENKENFLEMLRDKYDERVKYIDPTNEQNVFSWKNRKLHFHILLTHNPYNDDSLQYVIVFATFGSSNKDELTYEDLVEKTRNYEFDHIKQGPKKSLEYLVQNKIIQNPHLIESSVMFIYIVNKDLGTAQASEISYSFADNEYESTTKELQMNLISTTQLDTIQSKYFTDRYHFDDIKNSLNDEQFSYELEDCLKAYQNGMWFVSSTGIGSVIEHLLYLTIVNLDNKWTPSEKSPQSPLRQLGRGPTKSNYINALSKCLPRFDDRQRSQLEAMFLLRNSVDHFNSGYSNKGFCDTLLQGIVDIYNGIYLQSI